MTTITGHKKFYANHSRRFESFILQYDWMTGKIKMHVTHIYDESRHPRRIIEPYDGSRVCKKSVTKRRTL